MGLIEFCLLSLMTPQGPAQPPAHAGAAVEAVVAATPSETLAKAEAAGQYADASTLTELTRCPEEAVAARAAWILASSGNQAHLTALPDVVEASPHAEARLQALHGILQHGDISTTATAIHALGDPDRRCRTVAVQALGRLRRPAAIEPLLALIRAAKDASKDTPPTDVQAALLTLTDLGASRHLLRMASDVAHAQVAGCGQALAYAFQEMSPRLEPRDETTALIAVLGHEELLVRRYAIARLTELADPRSLAALDARLDLEGPALRPLLEVAVAHLMDDRQSEPAGRLGRLVDDAAALSAKAASWWTEQRATGKAILCAIPSALLFGLWLIRRSLQQRRRYADALAAAALVSPSDEGYDEENVTFEDDECSDYDPYEEHEPYDTYDHGEVSVASAPPSDAPFWPEANQLVAAHEGEAADDRFS